MFCPRCGTANPDQAKYCAGCGDPLAADRHAGIVSGATVSIPSMPGAQAVVGKPPTSGKAIASLVCGIFGFVFLGSIAAIILGHMALSEIRKSAGRIGGAGIATAGLVLGYIGIAIIPFILIIAAIAIPNLLRARQAANEASAVGTLRIIQMDATTYNTEFENGFPANLEVLGSDPSGTLNCQHAGLLDDKFILSLQKSGYSFAYKPVFAEQVAPTLSDGARSKACTSAGAPGFEVSAYPLQRGTTGQRSFFMDQTGVIRYSTEGTADADSAPQQ